MQLLQYATNLDPRLTCERSLGSRLMYYMNVVWPKHTHICNTLQKVINLGVSKSMKTSYSTHMMRYAINAARIYCNNIPFSMMQIEETDWYLMATNCTHYSSFIEGLESCFRAKCVTSKKIVASL